MHHQVMSSRVSNSETPSHGNSPLLSHTEVQILVASVIHLYCLPLPIRCDGRHVHRWNAAHWYRSWDRSHWSRGVGILFGIQSVCWALSVSRALGSRGEGNIQRQNLHPGLYQVESYAYLRIPT